MIKLVKAAKIYTPDYLGEKDLIIIGDKIAAIEENIELNISAVEVEVINGKNKLLVPGFIDSHVHILGGGGEGGFRTRTPEINLSDIVRGGVTTVVGCLGTDGITRSMESLLAKARALEEEGITTFIYSGSYRIPVTTLTGDPMRDIIIVDKVIGVGEIAISDHRSSQPTLEALKKLAADVRVGGILSGKAGILNIHVGDGPEMLNMLFDIVGKTEIPFTQFIPTHVNRNQRLLKDGIKYAKKGGYIDFTTSSNTVFNGKKENEASSCLKICIEEGVPENRITFSSDGQGSLPVFNNKKEFVGLEVGKVTSLYNEVRNGIINENIPIEKALRVITSNPAELLKLNNKGRIQIGYDADMVILDEDTLEINTVIAKGQIMVENKKVKKYGTFE